MKLLLLVLLFVVSISWGSREKGIHINITDIRNQKGDIKLAFFTDSKSYQEEKPKYGKIVSKKEMKDGSLTAGYADIPAGTYGIALLDDENSNGRMDYRFFIPVEGFGFSNYYHTGIGKPDFDKFAFAYKGGSITIKISIRYL
jgi:uncharacterized protein (DUF2141 family)